MKGMEMETEMELETENNNALGNEEKVEEVIKITITKEAEKALSEVVKRVNDSFEVGKINRQTVASWLLNKACVELSDAYIKAIRYDNFDPAAALAVLYKKVQVTGVVPKELKELLLSQVGLEAPTKKPVKSKLTKEYINDELKEIA